MLRLLSAGEPVSTRRGSRGRDPRVPSRADTAVLARRVLGRPPGVGLVVLKQDIDTSTPTGRLVFHILAAFDEFQRELIVEGTLEGLEAARARGRTGGRKPKLTDSQVKHARELYADGEHTVAQIAALLGVSRQTVYRILEPEAVTA